MKKKITIPSKAKENAKNAVISNYVFNKNVCATNVGKRRSLQILEDKYLTEETAKRTFSYLSRAKAYDKKDWSKCGTISYNLWGGDAMYKHLKKIFKK
jgi:hypothetical protein